MSDQCVIYYSLFLNHCPPPVIKQDHISHLVLLRQSAEFAEHVSAFTKKSAWISISLGACSFYLHSDRQHIIWTSRLRSAPFLCLKRLVNTNSCGAKRHAEIEVIPMNKWGDSTSNLHAFTQSPPTPRTRTRKLRRGCQVHRCSYQLYQVTLRKWRERERRGKRKRECDAVLHKVKWGGEGHRGGIFLAHIQMQRSRFVLPSFSPTLTQVGSVPGENSLWPSRCSF